MKHLLGVLVWRLNIKTETLYVGLVETMPFIINVSNDSQKIIFCIFSLKENLENKVSFNFFLWVVGLFIFLSYFANWSTFLIKMHKR